MNLTLLRQEMLRLKIAHNVFVRKIRFLHHDVDAFKWASGNRNMVIVYCSLINQCRILSHEIENILNSCGIEFKTAFVDTIDGDEFYVHDFQHRRATVRIASGLKKLHRAAEAAYSEELAKLQINSNEHTRTSGGRSVVRSSKNT